MPVGRPREFDRGEALAKATDVFWERGYECAQIDELLDAMGIGRGSMYAAFGDKRTLYLEALDGFVDRAIGFYRRNLFEGDGTPFENLIAFIGRWPEIAKSAEKKGCFITNALIEKAATDEDVARLTTRALREEEVLLRGVLSEAQDLGELGKNEDSGALAKAIVNARLGVTMQARLGGPLDGIQGIAESMISLLIRSA